MMSAPGHRQGQQAVELWAVVPVAPRDGEARLHRADQVVHSVRLELVSGDPIPGIWGSRCQGLV